ncbi:MAG: hypothetical protein ABUK11_01455 [Mariprofundaceae bacterium]
MPSQKQISTGLKHINLLRKALVGKHAITIDFEGMEWSGQVSLSEGMFDSNDRTIPCLTNAFSLPVFRYSWQAPSQTSSLPFTELLEPKLAFYRALMGIDLDEQRLINYQIAFSKLPPVHIKAGALFRLNMEDMKHYKILYHMGLTEKGADMSEYLNVLSHPLLLRRIRIVLTCYCLGQLIPVNNIKETTKMSMAKRILTRIRKMG